MTNLERIKNMNAEELALYFNAKKCYMCACQYKDCAFIDCVDGIKEWLESEVEE